MKSIALLALSLAFSGALAASNPPLQDIQGIQKAIELYAGGAKAADADLMAKAFTADATIHGYVDGHAFNGPIQLLFDEVKKGKPMPNLVHEITSIEVTGTVAAARVDEMGWLLQKPGAPAEERAFTDYFTLLKVDGTWQIVSKVFQIYPK